MLAMSDNISDIIRTCGSNLILKRIFLIYNLAILYFAVPRKKLEDLKKTVEELKIPKSHSPRM